MITIRVEGPEVQPGDDLAALIAERTELADGDILVVTSKVVSKAEGRIRAMSREEAIDTETVRVVARHGSTRIVQTRHGLVMAAAGVDSSNVAPGHVLLLPEDPDASARRIRAGLRDRAGVQVAVIISDTFGRPWRMGQTDIAIGAAGIAALEDMRGQRDTHGNVLEVTLNAVADELASAGELVKGKASGIPVAVVRGLGHMVTAEDGEGARVLVRPADETCSATAPGRTHAAPSQFTDDPVDPEAVRRAVAPRSPRPPAPHHAVAVRAGGVRRRTKRCWTRCGRLGCDLRSDGCPEEAIARRTRRGTCCAAPPTWWCRAWWRARTVSAAPPRSAPCSWWPWVRGCRTCSWP